MRQALAAVTIIKAAAVVVKAVANKVEVVVLAAEADVEGLEVVQADPAAVVARDVVVLVLPVAAHLEVAAFLAAGAARLEVAVVDSRPVVAEEEHRHEISSILTHSGFTFTS